MEFQEFTGKTIDDAIIEAATSLGVASTDLETEVVFKGSMGFLGIGAKPAVIKARPKKADSLDDILGDTSAARSEKPAKKTYSPLMVRHVRTIFLHSGGPDKKSKNPKNRTFGIEVTI